MFFDQEFNLFDIKNHLKNEWGSLFTFCEEINEINEEVKFIGHGFFNKKQENQFFDFLGGYILALNDKYYIILGEENNIISENNWFKFQSIIEVDKEFISSYVINSTNNKFSKFETELIVEIKHYQYKEEEKIMISKKGIGNIDLYASYSIKNKDKLLNGKVYPSANVAAKNQLMTKVINERFSNIKKSSEEEEDF